MAVRCFRSKKPEPARAGDYDVDAFAVELYDEDDSVDFRFELGAGLGIYWALPAARGDRLRLFHVDGAAYHVDEPELFADPFLFEYPRTEWPGAAFSPSSPLRSVVFEASVEPARYRCEIVLAGASADRLEVFAWSADPARAFPAAVGADVERGVAERWGAAALESLRARRLEAAPGTTWAWCAFGAIAFVTERASVANGDARQLFFVDGAWLALEGDAAMAQALAQAMPRLEEWEPLAAAYAAISGAVVLAERAQLDERVRALAEPARADALAQWEPPRVADGALTFVVADGQGLVAVTITSAYAVSASRRTRP